MAILSGLAAALAGTEGAAAQAVLTDPGYGYVADSSATLRPLAGVPGSGSLGPAINLGFAATGVVVSPRHDFALAVNDRKRLLLVSLVRNPESTELGEAPDRIEFSPAGRSAALYYRGESRLCIISDLPAASRQSRDIDVSGAGAALTAVAVSDDGVTALASAGGALFAVTGSSWRAVGAFGDISAIEFHRDRNQAVVADRLHNSLFLWDGSSLGPLAGETDGLRAPIALAISFDRSSVVIAQEGSGDIAILDLGSGTIRWVPSPIPVTGFERLRGSLLFRLKLAGPGPVLVLDGDQGEPRVVVVPLAAPAEAGGER